MIRRRTLSDAAIIRFVNDYPWIHTVLGLVGNTAFLVGSVLFLFRATETAAIWLFITGASGMLLGSLGSAIVTYEERSPTSTWQLQPTDDDRRSS